MNAHLSLAPVATTAVDCVLLAAEPAAALALQQLIAQGLETASALPHALARPQIRWSTPTWPDTSWPAGASVFVMGQAMPAPGLAACEAGAAIETHWRAHLAAMGLGFVVLYGTPLQQRLHWAMSMQAHIPQADWSWATGTAVAPAEPARLRHWGCEQCSDPDCERRLFDALRLAG